MPYPLIFPLGWGLGYLVTTGMKKLCDHYLPGKDLDQSVSQDENTSSGNKRTTVPKQQTDPAGSVCLEQEPVIFEDTDINNTEISEHSIKDKNTSSGNQLSMVPKQQTDPAGSDCLEQEPVISEDTDINNTEVSEGSTEDKNTSIGNQLSMVPQDQTDAAGSVWSVNQKVDDEASVLDLTKTSSPVATQDVSSVFGNNLPIVPTEQTDPAGKVSSGTELTEEPLISSISSLALSEMKSINGTFSSTSDLNSSSDEEFISEGCRVYNENRVLDLSKNSLSKRGVSVEPELNCPPDGEAGLTDRNNNETPANDGSLMFPKDKTTPDGVVVSHNERKVVGNHCCTVPQEQTDPDGKVEHEEQSRTRQTEDICRFVNHYNNSWMNAGFQSVLNLSVTRRCLAQRHLFREASSIPNCASLIHTAVHKPGYYFSPAEISLVLMELREREPSPELGKQFEISCLLESVLVWLDSYGGSTDCEMYCENTCTGCGTSFSQLLNNSPIVVLPSSTSLNNTALLFNNWINLWGQPDCSSCRSSLNRKNVLSNNTVIVLFLPRWVKRRYRVIPSPVLEVPGETGTELYSLSSIICGDAESEHFYTYLIRGQQTVKVVDEHVLTAGEPCSEDMYERGFIYVYEKQANVEEPHSVHLNTHSVTVSPGPPLQNEEESSGEEPEPPHLDEQEQNRAEDESSSHIEEAEMGESQIENWGPETYGGIEETFWEGVLAIFLFLFSLCWVVFPCLVSYWAGYPTLFSLGIGLFWFCVFILGF